MGSDQSETPTTESNDAEQQRDDPETKWEGPEAEWTEPEATHEDPEDRWGDPEAKWGDPEGGFGNLPEEESDSAHAPSDEPAETSADSETARYFWSAVALANIAVAAVSIGLLLIAFRGQWGLGGGLVAVGLLAGVRTYRIYRRFQRDPETGSGATATEQGDDE